MTIDIIPHIEKLLYTHETLVIPNLGAFQSARAAARPDAVSGVVNPPAKSLTFNEALNSTDDVLAQDIAASYNITLELAREVIQSFVTETQDLLNKREIVTFPGVGRLYKNYLQQIQFLPDSTNFNTDAYALPPLQFSPINRSREVEEESPAPAPEPVSTAKPATVPAAVPPPYPPYSEESEKGGWLPLVGLSVVALLAVGIYFFFLRPKFQEQKAQESAISAQTEQPTTETAAQAEQQPAAQPETAQPAAEKKTQTSEKPAPTPKPAAATPPPPAPKPQASSNGARTCIIVIGVFKDPANIRQLEQKLQSNGFTVYENPAKNGRQIGIRFQYSDLKEVQQNLNTLEKITGVSDLWIKQK